MNNNLENKQQENQIIKISNFIRDYAIISTFLIYFLGYIYTAGELFFFANGMDNFPLSLDLFLKNGIYVSLLLLALFIFSSFIYWGFMTYTTKRKKKFIRNLNPFNWKIIINFAFLIIYVVLSIFILYNIDEYLIFAYSIATQFIIFFTWCLVINQMVYEQYQLNVKIKDYLSRDDNQSEKYIRFSDDSSIFILSRFKQISSYNGYLIVCFSLLLILMVFAWGLVSQKIHIKKYTDGEGAFKFATVYNEKGQKQKYLIIDTTKDLLIGYQKGSLVIFPTSKISKIEMNDVVLKRGKIEDSSSGLSEEEKKVIETINKYYIVRTKTLNAKELLELITKKFYRDEWNYEPEQVISKRLEISKEYNGRKIDQFITFKATRPTKIGNKYEVLVNEYWYDENISVKYIIEKEDGSPSWKISSVNYNNYFLRFE
ncbi:hypothetical protein [Brevibacillus aydinogluensis]|uniref:Uncharacterized protein n=1 Tax=Brevibacillus aydinogluensis TaxID=927786 RepID=A0AA48M5X6_9BACL|nr:hypothetical protein [Brevibacillus aydinogluensis]CAJ1001854.1 hypothetical protein BSPP4475_05945 [Brevibacillus aydinogluensis]